MGHCPDFAVLNYRSTHTQNAAPTKKRLAPNFTKFCEDNVCKRAKHVHEYDHTLLPSTRSRDADTAQLIVV